MGVFWAASGVESGGWLWVQEENILRNIEFRKFARLRDYGRLTGSHQGALLTFGIRVMVCCLRKTFLTPRPIAGADLESRPAAISDVRVSWKQNAGHWAPSYGHSHSSVTRLRHDWFRPGINVSPPTAIPPACPQNFVRAPHPPWHRSSSRTRSGRAGGRESGMLPLLYLGARSPLPQALYLVMACRDHGYRSGLGPYTLVPLPQR